MHSKLGDRSFSAAGPRLWNDLPRGLRRPGLTFDSFRPALKSHLYLATEALSDSVEFIGAIEINLSIYPGMNGESTSMVWPTLGSRTAKEQNIYQCVAELVVYHVVRYYVTRE